MVLGNVVTVLGSGFLGTVLSAGLRGMCCLVLPSLWKTMPRKGQQSQRGPTSGPGAYTITSVAVAGVIGYAYIKWKGWKLSDLMFVTKRGLSDACKIVGGQLDQVSDSVIDQTADGIHHLCQFTQKMEDGQRASVGRQVSSIPAAIGCSSERAVRASLLQATCLPRPAPRLAPEEISPIADESPRAETSRVSSAIEPLRGEVSQEHQGVVSQTSRTREGSSESLHRASSSTEAPILSLFGGLKLPGLSSFLGLLLKLEMTWGPHRLFVY